MDANKMFRVLVFGGAALVANALGCGPTSNNNTDAGDTNTTDAGNNIDAGSNTDAGNNTDAGTGTDAGAVDCQCTPNAESWGSPSCGPSGQPAVCCWLSPHAVCCP